MLHRARWIVIVCQQNNEVRDCNTNWTVLQMRSALCTTLCYNWRTRLANRFSPCFLRMAELLSVDLGSSKLDSSSAHQQIPCEPAWRSRYSDSLRVSRSRNLIPLRSKFFLLPSNWPWDPLSLLYYGYQVSFPEVKRQERGVDHTTTSVTSTPTLCLRGRL